MGGDDGGRLRRGSAGAGASLTAGQAESSGKDERPPDGLGAPSGARPGLTEAGNEQAEQEATHGCSLGSILRANVNGEPSDIPGEKCCLRSEHTKITIVNHCK